MILKKRYRQLEAQLELEYDMLQEYERQLTFSNDPKEKRKASVEIETIRERIRRYEEEFGEVEARLADDDEEDEPDIPKLALFIRDGSGQLVTDITTPGPLKDVSAAPTDEELDEKVEHFTTKLNTVIVPNLQQRKDVDQEVLERYRKEYLKTTGWLKRGLVLNRSVDFGYYIELALVLKNEDTKPATDLELRLEFPEDAYVVEEAIDPTRKERWAEPGGGMRLMTILADELKEDVVLEVVPVPPIRNTLDLEFRRDLPPQRGPIYNHLKNSVVRFTTSKLRHRNAGWELPVLKVYLSPFTTGQVVIPFGIYTDDAAVESRLTITLPDTSPLEIS